MANKSNEPECHSGVATQNNAEIEIDLEALNENLWSDETPESKAFFADRIKRGVGVGLDEDDNLTYQTPLS